MTSKKVKKPQWNLASLVLIDAYTDFILSRQAMNCTPATIRFYRFTAGAFLSWCEAQGVASPEAVTARHVRQYLARLIDANKKDTTVHANARAIRTLLRFWHAENYMPTLIKFDMPKLSKKRLPVLTVEQLKQVLSVCNKRDKALVMFMVDSGLRRAEVCALNWRDVDMTSGLVIVRMGKGKKDRASAIGAKTRRALLAYRRTLADRDSVLFQTETGTRFSGNGLMMLFRRLSKKSGIYVTAHSLRRTFTILALRAGMSPLHLQNLGGWTSLDMVEHYAQMEDFDLLQEYQTHSPIDGLSMKSRE